MKRASDHGSTPTPYSSADDYKKRRFNIRYAHNYSMGDPFLQTNNNGVDGAYYEQIMNMFSSMGGMFMGVRNDPEVLGNDFIEVDPTMRTIYIGDLPENVTYSDIADKIHVGILERIKLLPDRNCAFVTFVDSRAAHIFSTQAQLEFLRINGKEVKIGSGRPSIATPSTIAAVENGASRTVFIGNLSSDVTESTLKEEFSNYGIVESIQIIPEKKMAFVHMTSISSTKKAIAALSSSSAWTNRRLNYGKDRCDSAKIDYKQYDKYYRFNQNFETIMNFPSLFVPNRTVYIGNIHPDVTTRELCDVVRGGKLQNIKYFKEKNIAFATFISPLCALQFYTWGNMNLVLKGRKLKLGWGNPSALPNFLCEAVQRGASRNVYIGNMDESITEEKLRKDFSEFGEIELINIVPEKNIGFVNFLDIISAIKAIDVMKNSPEYSKFKISFGKDRCRNTVRPYRENRLQRVLKPRRNNQIEESNTSPEQVQEKPHQDSTIESEEQRSNAYDSGEYYDQDSAQEWPN